MSLFCLLKGFNFGDLYCSIGVLPNKNAGFFHCKYKQKAAICEVEHCFPDSRNFGNQEVHVASETDTSFQTVVIMTSHSVSLSGKTMKPQAKFYLILDVSFWHGASLDINGPSLYSYKTL